MDEANMTTATETQRPWATQVRAVTRALRDAPDLTFVFVVFVPATLTERSPAPAAPLQGRAEKLQDSGAVPEGETLSKAKVRETNKQLSFRVPVLWWPCWHIHAEPITNLLRCSCEACDMKHGGRESPKLFLGGLAGGAVRPYRRACMKKPVT